MENTAEEIEKMIRGFLQIGVSHPDSSTVKQLAKRLSEEYCPKIDKDLNDDEIEKIAQSYMTESFSSGGFGAKIAFKDGFKKGILYTKTKQ